MAAAEQKRTGSIDNQPRYPQWTFTGSWSDEDVALIEAVLKRYMQPWEDNSWYFDRLESGRLMAHRQTWDMHAWWAQTAAEIAEKLEDYYTRPIGS